LQGVQVIILWRAIGKHGVYNYALVRGACVIGVILRVDG